MKTRIVLVAALIAQAAVLAGQMSAPSSAALSTERLARIDRLLQQYVDENRLAGAVALVLRDGRPIYERAFGWSDKEAGRKMTVDTIFRIASQSKAITSATVLSLFEEGRSGSTIRPAASFPRSRRRRSPCPTAPT
jgi:CubicO group peptidase (beta-lactamase class C family)